MSDTDKHDKNCIYVILTAEKFEGSPYGFPNYGSTRLPGYFTDLDEARDVVKNNIGDIWETVYDYACIEKVSEGLYGTKDFCEWYKYNADTGCYEKIDTPKFEEHICGRTIG